MRVALSALIFALALLFFTIDNTARAEPVQQGPDGEIYIVQPGDFLSQIAREQMNDGKAWAQIVDATNAKAQVDDTFAPITDPRLIYAGQRLWIPRESDPPTLWTGDELLRSSPDGHLFGYINANGQYAIEPRFVIAGDFHEGLAAASVDGLTFGFIDPTGEVVIPATFGDVGFFAEGLAPAMLGGESFPLDTGAPILGYINTAGEWVIEPQYLSIEPFRNGVARVVDSEYHSVYIDPTGATLHRSPVRILGSSAGVNLYGRLPTGIFDIPEEDKGVCRNTSAYLQHPAVWRCDVASATYDPCLVAEDGVSVVCRDPFGTIASDDVIQTLDDPISVEGVPDGTIDSMWIGNFGVADDACVRVPPSDESHTLVAPPIPGEIAPSTPGQITLNELYRPGTTEIDPALLSYRCADGSFRVGEPWYVPTRERWFIQKVTVGADGEPALTTVSVDYLTDLATAIIGPGGGPSDFIPLGIRFSRY